MDCLASPSEIFGCLDISSFIKDAREIQPQSSRRLFQKAGKNYAFLL